MKGFDELVHQIKEMTSTGEENPSGSEESEHENEAIVNVN